MRAANCYQVSRWSGRADISVGAISAFTPPTSAASHSPFAMSRMALCSATRLLEEIDRASPETQVLADERLWNDWLAFLAGAAENGGVAVR